MRCVICKKTCEEVELYEGIFEDGMMLVCSNCSEKEGIPIIRKPSQEQLKKAEKRYSVRERMERLSGRSTVSEISQDQSSIQNNLARLRVPEEKEKKEDVVDNYYWELNIARRRKKLSIKQVSELTSIPYEVIEGLEKGKIPQEYASVFLKLESFFGIPLLKDYRREIIFHKSRDYEKEILEEVEKKMKNPSQIREEFEDQEDKIQALKEKSEKLKKIRSGELDFSSREKLENITLNDLVEIKRSREKQERRIKERVKEDTLLGDDLDLDLEEV